MKIRYSILLLLAFVFAACSQSQSSPDSGHKYAVSIEPQRWILEQLVDSAASVTSLVRSGSDPETFEPTIKQRSDLSEADIYFTTGTLPFENKLAEGYKGMLVNASTGIEPVYGTHEHCTHHHHDGDDHGHGAPDPHMWTSVSGVRTMASNMAAALLKQQPQDSAAIAQRLATLNQRLDSVQAYVDARLQPIKGQAFAIWHPSLSYLAREYGLEQLTVGQGEKEMSVRQARGTVDHAREEGVKVFFFQKEYDVRQARTLNTAIGSRLVLIDPMSYDWEEQIKLIADELARP